MSPSIEVDEEVWEQLKAEAEPFIDTPNSVIRRLLGLDQNGTADHGSSAPAAKSPMRRRRSSRRRTKRQRAPMGSLLPESEYEIPILRVLEEAGGHAASRDVIEAVGRIVGEKLTQLDREDLPKGGKRWENRVQFTRLRLKERGLLESSSPRGIWEISPAGREHLAQQGEA